jgi:cytochrome c5
MYTPTPGFSAQQGTPISNPPPPAAPAAVANRLAPPPSAGLVRTVTADEQAAIQRLPSGNGRDLVLANCLICHSAALVEQQHKDTAAWSKTVTQMMAWGAPLAAAQEPALVAYLAQHFGARASTRPPVGVSTTLPPSTGRHSGIAHVGS